MTYKLDLILSVFLSEFDLLSLFLENLDFIQIQIGAFLPILLDANILPYIFFLVNTFFQKNTTFFKKGVDFS
jgi:hypothetical protein